jgi:WD40 repeat protein
VLSPDGKTLFTGDDDGNIFLYDVDTEKPIQTLHTVTGYPLIVPNDEQEGQYHLQSEWEATALSGRDSGA